MLLSDFIQSYASNAIEQPIINIVSEPGIGSYSTIRSALYQSHGDNLQEIVQSNDHYYDEKVSPVATAVLIDVVSLASIDNILTNLLDTTPHPMIIFLNAIDLPPTLRVLQVETYLNGMNVFVR